MIDLFSGLLTPLIAVLAAYIAWQQWRTNNLRLKHELFNRRYELYEAITAFLAGVVTRGTVDPNSEMQFLRDTKTVVFLFDKRTEQFIEEIYRKSTDLHALEMMENRIAGTELSHNVDRQQEIKSWFSAQLNTCPARFSPFLSFGDHQTMNENQRRLLYWATISVCILLVGMTWALGIAGFHYIEANHGDIFDKLLYHNNLRWLVPLVTALLGLLLVVVIGFIGFWFYLRDTIKSVNR